MILFDHYSLSFLRAGKPAHTSFCRTLNSLLVTMILAGVLAGCSSNNIKKQDGADDLAVEKSLDAEKAADELYTKAMDSLEEEKYKDAAALFEELERQYPYSRWATNAQMMAAYAYYAALRYDEALVALDRFIELHPGHKDVPYALYLKALSYYEQIGDVKRDQFRTEKALEALDTVARRFPDSSYARDARYKRDLTLNHLAGKEMQVGRFYLRRKEVSAAINRFKNVVENYQTTAHVPEALHRLVESYLMLGLTDEARKVAAVLGYNYPGSKWYQYSYKLFKPGEIENLNDDKGWMERTFGSFFKKDSQSSSASSAESWRGEDSASESRQVESNGAEPFGAEFPDSESQERAGALKTQRSVSSVRPDRKEDAPFSYDPLDF